VSTRGVAKWEGHPETELSLKSQQLLDTALRLAADDVQERFTQFRAERAEQSKSGASPSLQLPPAHPSRIAPELVTSLGEGLRHHYTADNLLGPRTLLPVIQTQAEAIVSMARDAGGQILADLLQVGAGYAKFAGWLAHDSGEAAVATSWYRHALELAEAAGDDRMAGFVLMRRSVQAISARSGSQAAQLAHAAQRSRDPSTLRVRAIAAQMEAVGYAVDGAGTDADRALTWRNAWSTKGRRRSRPLVIRRLDATATSASTRTSPEPNATSSYGAAMTPCRHSLRSSMRCRRSITATAVSTWVGSRKRMY